jgi:serine/threonine-protein kinase RsbT
MPTRELKVISAQPEIDLQDPRGTIERVLARFISTITARAIVEHSANRCGVAADKMRWADVARIHGELKRAVRLYLPDAGMRAACEAALDGLLTAPGSAATVEELRVPVRREDDVLRAREAARVVLDGLRAPPVLQTKVITAVSELARNIVQYAGSGELVVRRLDGPRRGIEVIATDRGPGIPHLRDVLDGAYRSRGGMGAGLRGVRALMDQFDIQATPGSGTRVTARKHIA